MTTQAPDALRVGGSDWVAEEWAWECFAAAHRHEAYALDAERFWKYYQTQRPGVSRLAMERILRETDDSATTGRTRLDSH